MNAVSFETACEARYALERACAPLSAVRRSADHLATMRAEIHRQGQPGQQHCQPRPFHSAASPLRRAPRPKSGASVSCPASMMPRRIARVRVK